MKQSYIKYIEKPILNDPVLIVGLPGVGNVGKLAAEHLISTLNAKRFAVLFSPHFPYHVTISEEGIIRLLNNEFYYFSSNEEKSDLLVLSGDYQSQTISGQYEVAGLIIDVCKEFNIKKIITMGGYATGNFEDLPKVYGAINHPSLNVWFNKLDILHCEIGSPIVGAAGLLIGLAKFEKISGMCLLGETPGFLTDAKAAKALLERVIAFLELQVDLSKLDEIDQEMKDKVNKIKEIEKQKGLIKQLKEKFAPSDKDLSYFG